MNLIELDRNLLSLDTTTLQEKGTQEL